MSHRLPRRWARARLHLDLLEDRVVPSFTSPVIFSDNAPGGLNNPGCVATGDLTGDGKPDLAITNYGAKTVSVFFNDGAGNFASTPDKTLNTGVNNTSYVAIADVNGDGKQDI